MGKFSKGDKARVISVDNGDIELGIRVGDIVVVDEDDSHIPYCVMLDGKVVVLSQDQLEYYIENPKEITLNGATYVLKEEPKPEHEWKFGDWARHPEYGVVFVGNVNGPDEIWCVIEDSLGRPSGLHLSPTELTYISSTTIPV